MLVDICTKLPSLGCRVDVSAEESRYAVLSGRAIGGPERQIGTGFRVGAGVRGKMKKTVRLLPGLRNGAAIAQRKSNKARKAIPRKVHTPLPRRKILVTDFDPDSPDLEILLEVGRSHLTGKWHARISTRHGVHFYSPPFDAESEAMAWKETAMESILPNFLKMTKVPFRVN